MPKPHHQIDQGNVHASIWANEGGARGTFYTFSIAKSYKRDGKTEYSTSFGFYDGLRVIAVVIAAVQWIANKQRKTAADAVAEGDEQEERETRSSKSGAARRKRKRAA